LSDVSLVFNLIAKDRATRQLKAVRAQFAATATSLAKAGGALAALPATATLAAGVLALAPAFGAAALGAGALAAVAVPSLTRIKEALAAEKTAKDASTQSAVQAQSRALALAGAQQSLAAAVRNAGFAHKEALDRVRQSEMSLASAQQSALAAQRALNDARADARRNLQDMANQVTDAQLAVRSSTFALTDAQDEYNRVLADPSATQDQIDRAQLAVDQANQSLNEQQLNLERLTADEKAAAKAGVEGSQQVRQAREQVASTNAAVSESERDLADARADVARTDIQSAEAVATARRALAAASLQGAASTAALDTALAKLSPSERKVMADWKGLSDAFDKWQRSMEPTVLPLFSRGIGILKGQLPSLTPLVKGAAGAVSGLLADVERGAQSERFTKLKANLTALAPTAITSLGRSTENIVSGISGIFEAFLPRAPQAIAFVEKLTQKFEAWGSGFGSSPGFQKVMAWIDANGPQVAAVATEVANALVHVGTSLAPMGGALGMSAVSSLSLLAKAVSGLSPGQIQALAAAFLAYKTAAVGVTAAKGVAGTFDLVSGSVSRASGLLGKLGKGGAGGVSKLASGWETVRLKAMYAGDAMAGVGKGGAKAAASGWETVRLKAVYAGEAMARAGRSAASGVSTAAQIAAGWTKAGLAAAASAVKFVAIKTAQLAIRTATMLWAAAQAVLNVALSANPIGLIIIAVVALAAGIVLLWKKSDTFRRIVTGAFNAVWGAVKDVFGWTKRNWPLLLGILTGPIGWAVLAITKNWDKIKAGGVKVWDWIKSLPGKISGAFSKIATIISAPYKAGFNLIAKFWNNTVGRLHFTVPPWVPGLGGKGFSFPQLPYLAKGGHITGAGMAMVGERGPEVVHLPAGATVSPLSRAGGGGEVKVTFDFRGADQEMHKLLRKLVRVEGQGDVQVAFGRS
jgi:hypothetical protein